MAKRAAAVEREPAYERIFKRREELGMSREELAKKLGTDRVNIWRIETGKTRLLVEDLPDYAQALSCDVADLVG